MIDSGIKSIKLSAEYLDGEPINYDNLNTDVIVQLKNGEKYTATFYSMNNLKCFIKEVEKTDEFNSGQYYKLVNMILVKNFNNGNLFPVIESMLNEGDFQLVFKKV